MKINKRGNVRGTNFRWVVPQLPAEVWSRKEAYKAELLDKLLASKTAKKGIRYYSIAIESHADGNPHLDLLLIFEKKIDLKPTELDFLCDKHGDLTRYRTLNQAILNYGSKEDTPLSNLSPSDAILDEQKLKNCPEKFFMQLIDQDPFHFDFRSYCTRMKNLHLIKNWSSVKNKMKDYQEARCNLVHRDKPGIQKITDKLIQRELTPLEQEEFYSWHGYQQIVDKINEIGRFNSNRPFKSKQLLLVGPPDIGKTSLINALQVHIPVYPMGVSNWFPRYQANTYRVIAWNEFRLSLMSYPLLLQFLEGSYMDLQYKGGSTLKSDNPLVIMTSNLTLKNHIWRKFKNDEYLLKAALLNAPARIDEIVIPEFKDLFFLQKLIVPI